MAKGDKQRQVSDSPRLSPKIETKLSAVGSCRKLPKVPATRERNHCNFILLSNYNGTYLHDSNVIVKYYQQKQENS
uniref:Uncharacterized protein n=1 Tax=Solanum lycopersicum TaxID=4081 RepID=Q0KIH6_SOLLC|nr:hypothetical protein LES1_20t00017 [Solanum lycopersicum]